MLIQFHQKADLFQNFNTNITKFEQIKQKPLKILNFKKKIIIDIKWTHIFSIFDLEIF